MIDYFTLYSIKLLPVFDHFVDIVGFQNEGLETCTMTGYRRYENPPYHWVVEVDGGVGLTPSIIFWFKR